MSSQNAGVYIIKTDESQLLKTSKLGVLMYVVKRLAPEFYI